MHKLMQIIASLLLCFSLTGCGWFNSGDAGETAEANAAGDDEGKDEEAADDDATSDG